jgi:hypothetical protein
MPASASGVTSSVTSGIATRLATNPTIDTCWKNSKVSGASPTVAMACVRSALRIAARLRWRQPTGITTWVAAGSAPNSSATATKDNQKPGCSSAQGSSIATASAAASSTSTEGQRQPRLRSSTTTAIIATVRCAGTPQPASRA